MIVDYNFLFRFLGQKGLDLDMALAYWRIVMQGRFKFLDQWCRFLTVSLLSLTVP